MDQVRQKIRMKHYSLATEKSYAGWIKRYILFHGKRHPLEMGTPEIEAFLTHLAMARKVSSSTQNQALNAIVFLYKHVLEKELEGRIDAVRAKRPLRLPTVLSHDEAMAVIEAVPENRRLMIKLLYGCGLRLMGCLRLRVKDIDFTMNQILVRDGKGGKDRVTVLPENVKPGLHEQLKYARKLHEQDLKQGFGEVYLPGALSRKYPNAACEWGWQYVFPATGISKDPRTGVRRRHHLHESCLQKAVKRAAKLAGIVKPVGCHTFRHSFATEMLRSGYDIRTVQELLGHKDVSTTMVYTHVLNRGGMAVKSPIDV